MTDSTARPAPTAHPRPAPRARVVLLTGPSGSGKSRLAARTGLPVLRLDDFYKEGDDPTLPLLQDANAPADAAGSNAPTGPAAVDWDSPRAWDAEAALAAVARLCTEGQAEVPVYSIAASARTGVRSLAVGEAPIFLAEGIFAADIAGACAAHGLLADALCLSGRPLTTFRRRLLRDVREARKSVPVLVRRGWRLLRAEGAIVARHVRLGAHPCGRDEALARITALVQRAELEREFDADVDAARQRSSSTDAEQDETLRHTRQTPRLPRPRRTPRAHHTDLRR